MIDQTAYDQATAEVIAVVERPAEKLQYGWFVDAVLDEAETLLGMTSDQVLTGGFGIETTMSFAFHQDQLGCRPAQERFPPTPRTGRRCRRARRRASTPRPARCHIGHLL